MTTQERIQSAVDAEVAKLARVVFNIQAATEAGHITPHDGGERIARAEQWTENRIAFIRGDKRPAQRQNQPLDDPQAGVVE